MVVVVLLIPFTVKIYIDSLDHQQAALESESTWDV